MAWVPQILKDKQQLRKHLDRDNSKIKEMSYWSEAANGGMLQSIRKELGDDRHGILSYVLLVCELNT